MKLLHSAQCCALLYLITAFWAPPALALPPAIQAEYDRLINTNPNDVTSMKGASTTLKAIDAFLTEHKKSLSAQEQKDLEKTKDAIVLMATATALKSNEIRELLDKTGLKYKMEESGHASVTFSYDEKRSQKVWVSSDIDTFGSYESRQVYSIALYRKPVPAAPILAKLLENSRRSITGRWELYQPSKDKDECIIMFTAVVPRKLDSATLKKLIEGVAANADEFEKELTDGKDDY